MEIREYDAMRALEDVHWWYQALRSLVLEQLPPGRRILDAGCGTGGMLDRLRDRDAVGIDISGVAVSHAARRGLPRICRASAGALPFRDGVFDAVLSLDVIYHREISDDAAAVAECARVLRPGGTFLLHVPAYDWLAGGHDRATHGVRRYTRARVARLVEDAGLEISALTGRNVIALFGAVARRRLRPSGGSSAGKRGESDLAPLPRGLNAALAAAGRAENAFLRHASIPAGLSIWCRAVKPAGRASAGVS
jgi:SAM-dependent methyltransferase